MDGAKFLDQVRNPLTGLLLEFATETGIVQRSQIISQSDIRAVLNTVLNGLRGRIEDGSQGEKALIIRQRRMLTVVLEMFNTYAHDHRLDANLIARCVAGTLGIFLASIDSTRSRSKDKIKALIDVFFANPTTQSVKEPSQDVRAALLAVRQAIETAVYVAGKEMSEPQHLLQSAHIDGLIFAKPRSSAELIDWGSKLPSFQVASHAKWISRQIERWGDEIVAILARC